MARRVGIIGLAGVVLAIGAIAVWTLRGKPVSSSTPAGSTGASPTADELEPSVAATATSDRIVAEQHRRGRVVDAGGRGIGGASLTFDPLPRGTLSAPSDAHRASDTDADGWFGMAWLEPESAPTRGVVWATASGFAATAAVLDPPEDFSREFVITLERANDIEIVVRGADGRFVDDATVVVAGLEPSAHGARPFSTDTGVRSAFRREFRTNTSGVVHCPRLSGPIRVEARSPAGRAQPFVGEAGTRIALTIGGVFSGHGRVQSDGRTLTAGARVVAESIRSGRRAELGVAVVGGDGAWRLDDLPVGTAEEVVFRCEALAIAPLERSIGRPRAGSDYTVDFTAEPGLTLPVLARRETGESVAGATVAARWYRDGRYTEVERPANSDGSASVPVPSGLAIYLDARADRYVGTTYGPWTYQSAPTEPIVMLLSPAGRIRGRCTHLGSAVADFEVIYWHERPSEKRLLRVNDAEDGEFVIDDAPLGEVSLCVHSADLPVGDVETVVVTEGEDAKVELEVGESSRGHGQVVDAASGEPVFGALVRAVTTLPDFSAVLRGPTVGVDTNGVFVLDGLPRGRPDVWVVAPDYGQRVVTGNVQADGDFDFGVIPLARTQTLEIQLESDTALDFSRVTAESFESPLLPQRTFDSDGRVVYEDVPPRQVEILLLYTDSLSEVATLNLVAGRPWKFTIRVDGGRKCHVRTRNAPEATPPTWIHAIFRREAGLTSRYARCDARGEASVFGVAGSELVLVAYDAQWRQLASKSCSIPEHGDFESELDCGRRPLEVRVVDADDRPIPGAAVLAALAPSVGSWFSRVTGADGTCTIEPLDVETITLRARVESLGFSAPVVVRLDDAARDVVTLRLAELLPLRVRLDDRGVALGGVTLSIRSDDLIELCELQTDAAGRASSVPAGDGRYFVDVSESGYWPIHHALPYPRTDAETAVPLRRLGGVKLSARAESGVAVAGARVELRSLEFDANVASWIDAGKLAAPSGGLVTNASGELVIDGLPNGPYEWSATAPDGSQATGGVDVPPLARTELPIVFGP